VWGSVCFTGLLAGLPLESAIERANRAAAVKILHPETATLRRRLAEALA
jgi:sugar/nucleoside kinase (ribokinase family)